MKHIPALDGLRGLAIALVLLFHSLHPAFRWGNVGVDVFFVLSGFLITRLLLEEQERTGTIAWRRFIQRRLWRLAPALGVFLAVYLVVAPLAWPNHPHLRDAAWAAIYFSDYSQALLGQPDYLLHTWSFSVE
jgi:peptidoglycan/LPS O-acetylase OafA/YrhL